MGENLIDQLMDELRFAVPRFYPQNGKLRNLRVVGHTPKADHYVYDIVADFDQSSERLAAKVYRPAKGSGATKSPAVDEFQTLDAVSRHLAPKQLLGLARPVGDFSGYGAVVTEKPSGLPLQSIIMKAALLPAYAELTHIRKAAKACGAWLRTFHDRTRLPAHVLDVKGLLSEIEDLCSNCKGSGLDDSSIKLILAGSHNLVEHAPNNLPHSSVLNDFTPLNIAIGEQGVGVYDYSSMALRGSSLDDVGRFLANVEALEKYPFCARDLTSSILEEFCSGYGLESGCEGIVRVLKMKFLLGMFARGRSVKETAVRKKVMWANVMKRFIQSAVERSMHAA
jgi:hypothetical protein